MTYEFFQTVALCISSIALVVIAIAMFFVAVRLVTMVTPFDLMGDLEPVDDDEDEDEIEILAPQKKRRSGRKL